MALEYSTSITKTGAGRFRAFLRYKDEDGNWKQRNKTLPASVTSKRAATKAAREWAESLADAIGSQTEAGRMTVADYVREYWEMLSATGAIEASTASARRPWVERVARSPLGARHMADVTPRDLERFVAELRADGYAPGTVTSCYYGATQAIRHAAEIGDIPTDPTARARKPRSSRPSPNALAPDQCRRSRRVSRRCPRRRRRRPRSWRCTRGCASARCAP